MQNHDWAAEDPTSAGCESEQLVAKSVRAADNRDVASCERVDEISGRDGNAAGLREQKWSPGICGDCGRCKRVGEL